MNLGLHTGDEPARVLANRAALRRLLPAEPVWLSQVHGAAVFDADTSSASTPDADASCATGLHVVCAVLVADCLPVLLTDTGGRVVAAAHAGWRGLAAGVLQNTVARLRARLHEAGAGPDDEIIAWLGPAIGPRKFEVGTEVLAMMQKQLPKAAQAFIPAEQGKYLADLFSLARQALEQSGVMRVFGGGLCTGSTPQHFYSYRRDGITGRHAALIWRDPPATMRGDADRGDTDDTRSR
jgi:YfiH family protein